MLLLMPAGDSVATIAPRLLMGLGDDWGDTVLDLPEATWTNEFTRETFLGREGICHSPNFCSAFQWLSFRERNKGADENDSRLESKGQNPSNRIEGESDIPCRRRRGEWWNSGKLRIQAGTDYAFWGKRRRTFFPTRVPPGSAEGIYGPSRTIDHHSFHWTDSRWQAPPLQSAIIYELHIGTFHQRRNF